MESRLVLPVDRHLIPDEDWILQKYPKGNRVTE